MKILNITFNNAKGGLEQAFMDYTIALQNHGHEVFCLTCANAKFLPDLKKISLNILHARFLRTRYFHYFLYREIRKILKRTGAELVMLHNERNILDIRKAARNLPLVAVNHGGKIKDIFVADHIFTVNSKIAEKLVRLGYKDSHITVIGNMIKL